jgi:hypothetical protein
MSAIYPTGVRRINEIEDSGPLVALTVEVDLDLLMLELASQTWNEFSGRTWEDYHDEPTAIWDAPTERPEPMVGWFRRIPANRGNCLCGGFHSFDLFEVSCTDKPTGTAARGAFLAVYFA